MSIHTPSKSITQSLAIALRLTGALGASTALVYHTGTADNDVLLGVCLVVVVGCWAATRLGRIQADKEVALAESHQKAFLATIKGIGPITAPTHISLSCGELKILLTRVAVSEDDNGRDVSDSATTIQRRLGSHALEED